MKYLRGIYVLFILSAMLFCCYGKEVALLEKTFTPPRIIGEQYHTLLSTIDMPKERPDATTRFHLEAEIITEGGASVGMKLRQTVFNRKDPLYSTFFWKKTATANGEILRGSTTLVKDVSPQDLLGLALCLYNVSRQGTIQVNKVTVRMETPDVPIATPPSEELLLEKVFTPPVEISTYYHRLLSVPMPEREFSADSLFTLQVSVSGEDGARGGMKLRQMVEGEKNTPYTTFFWNRALPENAEVVTATCRLDSSYSPEKLKGLQLFAYNCNKQGKMKIESIVLSEEKKKAETPQAPVAPVRKTFTHWRKKPDFFPAGVYLYGREEELKKIAALQNLSLEQYFRKIFQDIHAHSCNSIYLANLTMSPEIFQQACHLANEYGIKVFAQGTADLYIRATRGEDYFAEVTEPASRKFLPAYNELTNLAGYLNIEEVPARQEAMELLRKGRALAKELMPKIPIFMLHNNIKSMEMDNQEPQPDWYGFDRYRFRMVTGNAGELVISTPSDMARLIYREINEFYQFATERGLPLIFVGQGYKHEEFARENAGPRSGYREISPGVWRGYNRYMPRNGMNLQFYLSVAAGARGLLLYFYQSFLPRENAVSRSDGLVSLAGEESWYWKEIGDCLREATPLLPLFSSWFREATCPAKTDDATVYIASFVRPDLQGRFFLPVNTHIANWDGNNPIRAQVGTQLHSDEENLQGFEWCGNKTFKLQMPENDNPLWEVISGKKVNPDAIELPPGKGMVLFQGSEEECNRIRRELN
ncbi:MAG: hypothetical protein GX927_05990 [Lentisphaerae bacterium]|nr:hypothetical protein [Lentisphaerota bacterium]